MRIIPSASAVAVTSRGSRKRPASPHTSGIAQRLDLTVGVPKACASTAGIPKDFALTHQGEDAARSVESMELVAGYVAPDVHHLLQPTLARGPRSPGDTWHSAIRQRERAWPERRPRAEAPRSHARGSRLPCGAPSPKPIGRGEAHGVFRPLSPPRHGSRRRWPDRRQRTLVRPRPHYAVRPSHVFRIEYHELRAAHRIPVGTH